MMQAGSNKIIFFGSFLLEQVVAGNAIKSDPVSMPAFGALLRQQPC